jgi:hypothetical protein
LDSTEFPQIRFDYGQWSETRVNWRVARMLARDVDHALSNMRIPALTSDRLGPSLEVLNLESPPRLEPPPNPIWETNSRLAELIGSVTQLVGVARQQAELSQAIRDASDLALNYAIQSGEEAKAATQLARKGVWLTFGAIMVALITAILSVAVNFHLGTATDGRLQEEIRLLREISGQLKALNSRPPVDSAIKPKPQTMTGTGDSAGVPPRPTDREKTVRHKTAQQKPVNTPPS